MPTQPASEPARGNRFRGEHGVVEAAEAQPDHEDHVHAQEHRNFGAAAMCVERHEEAARAASGPLGRDRQVALIACCLAFAAILASALASIAR